MTIRAIYSRINGVARHLYADGTGTLTFTRAASLKSLVAALPLGWRSDFKQIASTTQLTCVRIINTHATPESTR